MKAWIWAVLIVAIILIIGAIIFISSNKGDSGGNTGQANSQANNINIQNFAFSPSTLTIRQGDNVIWTNQDSAGHTVTSDSGSELNSELLGKSESYSHTFNTAGTFEYHCKPHPYMKAKIIVE